MRTGRSATSGRVVIRGTTAASIAGTRRAADTRAVRVSSTLWTSSTSGASRRLEGRLALTCMPGLFGLFVEAVDYLFVLFVYDAAFDFECGGQLAAFDRQLSFEECDAFDALETREVFRHRVNLSLQKVYHARVAAEL